MSGTSIYLSGRTEFLAREARFGVAEMEPLWDKSNSLWKAGDSSKKDPGC